MTDRTLQRVDVDGGVVVGIDSSFSSLRALSLAAEEAARRKATLHVVRAWTMRTTPRPSDCPPGAVPSIQQYESAAREDTERLIASRLGDDPPCAIEIHVVHSPSPQALLSASRGAELLVVGHRGHGGFSGLMLGAVAEQCVRHASCPVLVVRPNI